jgi:hypothetical protein
MMGLFFRLLGFANAAREWISFANEAFSWVGLAQRAAAVTAGAALVAAPVLYTTKPWQSTPSVPAQVSVPAVPPATGPTLSDDQVKELLKKIKPENIYSSAYLAVEKNRPMLAAILDKCANTADLPVAQCDSAEKARKEVEFDEDWKRRKEHLDKL